MSDSKKLVVNLSETLNNEFNKALREDSKKRSQFIREAIILYIEEKKRAKEMELMRKGYMEMGNINLEFAEMGFASDIRELKEYEAKLPECDWSHDNDSEKRRYILC
ncbi:MAG: CopG family transcriptional regulator [Clostridium lundense]|nr:CopG family transcriptional regulator [Clostridium lundense]